MTINLAAVEKSVIIVSGLQRHCAVLSVSLIDPTMTESFYSSVTRTRNVVVDNNNHDENNILLLVIIKKEIVSRCV